MKISKRTDGIAPSLTLKINAMSNALKKQGVDIIGFGAGEPDFITPAHIREAGKRAIDAGFTKYTASSGMPELRKAACERYEHKYGVKYDKTQCIITSGAKQALFNTFQAIVDDGDEVIMPTPAWLTYPELIKMAGGVPVPVKTDETTDFKASAAVIEAAVTDKTVAILINNPSNPCGSVYLPEELKAIAEVAKKHDLYIVSDEIYDDLVYNGTPITTAASLGDDAYNRTIVINGMSKSYAMTGWRIGYTLSNPALAEAMGNFQSHSASAPCSIAQAASVEGLTGSQVEIAAMKAEFDARRKLMFELINSIDGISCLLPEGAFYIMMNISGVIGKKSDGKPITDALSFTELLLDKEKVAVTPGNPFGDERHVRLSYATSAENIKKGIARIGEFVKGLE